MSTGITVQGGTERLNRIWKLYHFALQKCGFERRLQSLKLVLHPAFTRTIELTRGKSRWGEARIAQLEALFPSCEAQA